MSTDVNDMNRNSDSESETFMPVPRFCGFCRHYNPTFEACMNPNSEYCADFRLETDKCTFFDERG